MGTYRGSILNRKRPSGWEVILFPGEFCICLFIYLLDRFSKHFCSPFNENLSEEVLLGEEAKTCLVKMTSGLRAGQRTHRTWLLLQCEETEDVGF